MKFPSWLKPRFSLRTLFIFVTLLCVGLGWPVYKARRLREAVAMVERFGGTITYEYQQQALLGQPHGPAWLRELLGDAYFNDVVTVAFYYPPYAELLRRSKSDAPGRDQLLNILDIDLDTTEFPLLTDAEVSDLCEFRNLQELQIIYSQITDAGARQLSGLKKLRELTFVKSRLTDQAVKELRGLSELSFLDLSENPIGDQAVPYFESKPGDDSGFSSLQSLRMEGTKLTDAGLLALVEQLPEQTRITLDRTAVTQAGILAVEAHWENKMGMPPPYPYSGGENWVSLFLEGYPLRYPPTIWERKTNPEADWSPPPGSLYFTRVPHYPQGQKGMLSLNATYPVSRKPSMP